MTVLAFVFSVLVAALGVLGLASPSKLLRLEEYSRNPPTRYIASAVRLLMGVALFFAAPASRAAGVLRTLGVFIFVAGVITLFFGPSASVGSLNGGRRMGLRLLVSGQHSRLC